MLHDKLLETSRAVKEMNTKKEFVRKVCHVSHICYFTVQELRTPMSSILGYLELIESHEHVKSDSSVIDYVENAVKSCSHLVSLLNSVLSNINEICDKLLDLEKFEAEKNQYKMENVNLRDLLRNVWVVISGVIHKNRHLQFQMLLRKGCPTQVLASESHLTQILINLIHNSVTSISIFKLFHRPNLQKKELSPLLFLSNPLPCFLKLPTPNSHITLSSKLKTQE
jgi:signal transduction histidine kinase